jgi:Amt family ammonium transporter
MADAIASQKIAMDTLWVMIAAFLVFFMNLGFALVESGFCRAKNTVNILFKNFVVFAVSSIAFLFLGFGLMFGERNPVVGLSGLLFASGADNSPATGDAYKGVYHALNWTGVPSGRSSSSSSFSPEPPRRSYPAPSPSGSSSSRSSSSPVHGGVIYPVGGHLIWEAAGWRARNPRLRGLDGGSLRRRMGRPGRRHRLGPAWGNSPGGESENAIPGHNMTSAAIGVLVLWFGWFGFNPGSTMAADGPSIAHVATTTNVAAAAATVSSMITAWLFLGKPDFGMTLNGCLAGLVAITAPCAFVSVPSSLVIGLARRTGGPATSSSTGWGRRPGRRHRLHLGQRLFRHIALGLFADPGLPCAAAARRGSFWAAA